MAHLNLNTQSTIPDYVGRGSAKQSAKVFYAGRETLAPIFQDENLTFMSGQPLRSDETGQFQPAYLIAGTYDVEIRDPRGTLLTKYEGIELRENDRVSYAQMFPSVEDVLGDGTLTYDQSTAKQQVSGGDLLRAAKQQVTYEVLDETADGAHVETAGGVKLAVAGRTWPAAAFGVIADSDPSGATGTDNGPAFDRLSAALSAQTGDIFLTFPPGVMRSSTTISIEGNALSGLHVAGDGSHIVFTHATPEEYRKYFSVRRLDGNGRRCAIHGLTLDLARNPLRTSGSDMICVGGFKDVSVVKCIVPSADNMAISVDRGIVTEAASVQILDNRIGGKPPVAGTTHEYGSIGDTGIWVLHAGGGTIISGNVIEGTGDDAIAITETSVTGIEVPAIIANNIVKRCQGTAYKSSASSTVFSGNVAKYTRGDMFRLIDLAVDGGTVVPKSFQINGGFGSNIGTATASDLNVDVLTSHTHRCGVHLQNVEGCGSIIGLHLHTTEQEAIKITSTSRPMQSLDIHSCVFDTIGAPGESVFRRDGGSSTYAVTDITFAQNVIRNTTARLFSWSAKVASGTEGNLDWRENDIRDCDFSGNAHLFKFNGTQTQKLVNFRFHGDRWNGTTGPSTSLVELDGADPSEFEYWMFDDGTRMVLPMGSVRMRNNQNPGIIGLSPTSRVRRGCKKTIPGSREFNASNVLMTFDPSKGWEIEAKAIRNNNADFDTLRYAATWDPNNQRVLHETGIGGGPDGNCALELVHVEPTNPEDQVFSGTKVLQLQGTPTGWTDATTPIDPQIDFQITWRRVYEAGHPVKID